MSPRASHHPSGYNAHLEFKHVSGVQEWNAKSAGWVRMAWRSPPKRAAATSSRWTARLKAAAAIWRRVRWKWCCSARAAARRTTS
ncbi:hypothetical protein BCAR13_40035 [Paraburkholderia caribensis]|nr:hypothetical protein BCAR13_40035 [Paraburkholderia caribensis]